MEHIGKHIISPSAKSKKDRATERGELMQYFMEKLNVARRRDGMPPLSMGRMGRMLVAIPTKDLYYLKSVCDDADKRNGLDAFCKKFWWEIKPRKEEEKEKSKTKKK
jgi:hypothetical protein